MVGLHAGTHSLPAVVGGILTIAIADACSDALGMHISEEAENVHTTTEVWVATGATFLTKLLVALSFLAPLFLFSLPTAICVAVVWGLSVLTVLTVGEENFCAKVGRKSVSFLTFVILRVLLSWSRSLG
jgi:hypothetical protein